MAEILIGLKAVAKYMQRARSTINRWDQRFEFPLSWLPDGRRATSTTLIDQWLRARREVLLAANIRGYDGETASPRYNRRKSCKGINRQLQPTAVPRFVKDS